MTTVNHRQRIARAALVVGAAASLAMACSGGSSVTAEQACANYAQNICTKFQACAPAISAASPNSSACEASNQAACLDSARAPRSGYAPSVVSACAAAIAAATCADDFTNLPACSPRGGTIQTGGSCGDDWQCASGWCSRTTPGPCGLCAEKIAKGGACWSGVGCAGGLVCEPGATAGSNSCEAPIPLGGTCIAGQGCPVNAYCKPASSSSSQGICSLFPEAGQACDPILQLCDFAYGIECNPSTLVCQKAVATVQPGAACGWIAGQYIACVGYCHPNQNGDGSTCTAVSQNVSEGAACGADGGTCAGDFQCVGGVCTDPGPTTCGGSGPQPDAGAPDAATSVPPFDIWDGGLADAHLADTIDVEACAGVDTSVDAASGIPPACVACCTDAGYHAARVNDGRCICGAFPLGPEVTTCAQQHESGACAACCGDAGFIATLFGTAGDAGDICTCLGIQDKVICASTTGAPNPIAACDLCCVRNSYTSYSYQGQGTGGTCTCQAG